MPKKIFIRNQVAYGKSRLPPAPQPKQLDTYEYIGEDGHRIIHSNEHPDVYVADLAFVLTEKRWPTSRVEHINGDPLDCRWSNLRESGEGKPRTFELNPGFDT